MQLVVRTRLNGDDRILTGGLGVSRLAKWASVHQALSPSTAREAGQCRFNFDKTLPNSNATRPPSCDECAPLIIFDERKKCMHLPDFETFRTLASQYHLVPVYRRLMSDALTPVTG